MFIGSSRFNFKMLWRRSYPTYSGRNNLRKVLLQVHSRLVTELGLKFRSSVSKRCLLNYTQVVLYSALPWLGERLGESWSHSVGSMSHQLMEVCFLVMVIPQPLSA